MKVLKAVVSVVLVAAVLAIASGCTQKEVETKREVEWETEHVVHQEPVVE